MQQPAKQEEKGDLPVRGSLRQSIVGLAVAGALLTPTAAPTAFAQDVTATLNPTNDSGVSGQAMVHSMGDMTQIMITVQGLEPNSRHAAHIHDGGCTASILVPLEFVVADASGTGTSTSNIPAAAVSTWYVQVHRN